MANENRQVHRGYEFVRASDTGDAYICPLGSIRDTGNAKDSELSRHCVNESENPQNN